MGFTDEEIDLMSDDELMDEIQRVEREISDLNLMEDDLKNRQDQLGHSEDISRELSSVRKERSAKKQTLSLLRNRAGRRGLQTDSI